MPKVRAALLLAVAVFSSSCNLLSGGQAPTTDALPPLDLATISIEHSDATDWLVPESMVVWNVGHDVQVAVPSDMDVFVGSDGTCVAWSTQTTDCSSGEADAGHIVLRLLDSGSGLSGYFLSGTDSRSTYKIEADRYFTQVFGRSYSNPANPSSVILSDMFSGDSGFRPEEYRITKLQHRSDTLAAIGRCEQNDNPFCTTEEFPEPNTCDFDPSGNIVCTLSDNTRVRILQGIAAEPEVFAAITAET